MVIDCPSKTLAESSSDEEENFPRPAKTKKQSKTSSALPEAHSGMIINCPVQKRMETHSQSSSDDQEEEEEPPAKTKKRKTDDLSKQGRNEYPHRLLNFNN